MLDLDAGVHLQEGERAGRVEQELDGPRAAVVDCSGEGNRGVRHGAASDFWKTWGGSFFEQLLMTALHRAVAIPDRDEMVMGVGHELHFDVPGVVEIAFQVDLWIGKRPSRSPAARGTPLPSPPGRRATRNPRPPPPPDALIATG
jgi:hypothetical protein